MMAIFSRGVMRGGGAAAWDPAGGLADPALDPPPTAD